tara:strand:+ start:2019 stop:3464 length:1446 start_codon:yes stop_codon:yes gene_type:complete
MDGGEVAGPILTVASERQFDAVYLFGTPALAERTEALEEALMTQHEGLEVTVLDVPLKDPTNYLGILSQLRRHFKKLNKKHPEANYSISVSSGTPHMHASWLLLAASGEIPAKILQSTPPQFVPEGKSRVREIDFTQEEFPQITKSLGGETYSETDEEQAILSLCLQTGIIGEDPAFLKALRQAYIYAQYDDANVLLLGETGCGKEFFAKFVHQACSRSARALVTVNCGSIPEKLVESQLFGHKKGAFTGATASAEGKFKAADGGVIFLDELGELPMSAQAKLLRVLEAGEIDPVGASRPEKVNVKVIAATNRDLHAMVAAGEFREDLYQRFGSIVRIPSLRERRMDIKSLAVHLLDLWNRKYNKQVRLKPDAIRTLMDYPWPGNIRELGNVIRESAMLCGSQSIGPDAIEFDDRGGAERFNLMPEPEEGFEMTVYLDELKGKLIDRALEKTGNVQAKAAKLLGVTPQAVSQRLKLREGKR